MITSTNINSMIAANDAHPTNHEFYGHDVYKLIAFEDDMAVIVNRNQFKLLVFPNNFDVSTIMFDQVPLEYHSKLITKHLYKKSNPKSNKDKESKSTIKESQSKVKSKSKSCDNCKDYKYCLNHGIITGSDDTICADYKEFKLKITKNQMYQDL